MLKTPEVINPSKHTLKTQQGKHVGVAALLERCGKSVQTHLQTLHLICAILPNTAAALAHST